MMRGLILLLMLLLPGLAPDMARGERIVLGLSAEEVAITATFDGSDILIFGAVRRDVPPPQSPPLQVVITVSGPALPVTVRRKERVFGIWMNRETAVIDRAPSFYAVASSAPLREALSETEDLRHRVSIGQAIRSVGNEVTDTAAFTEALVRVRAGDALYQNLEGSVDFEQQTLFRGSIRLPANLVEGNYATRIFLTRDGAVVDRYDTVINVQKVGLERWLFHLSRNQPVAYGLLAIAIAVLAGWGASAAFQALRR